MAKVLGQGGGPDIYQADFAPEAYTPPGVIPTPWEFLSVFLPDESIHGPRPAAGWPVLLATGFGGWASTPHVTEIADAPTDTARTLWLALEAGVAVVVFGIPGSDTHHYAPGGDFYNGGQGLAEKGNVVLGKPILGRGTYDKPAFLTAGYDHFADVGTSQDGGVSYPRQDYPIMQKSAVLALQYAHARGPAWGIDMRRSCVQARSAGAAVTQYALLGPDRADPEMKDHRSQSSRVPLALLIAGSYWWPGFGNSVNTAAPMFPDKVNPDAVAATMADAPLVYPREASGLRAGFRSYLTEGPGISGPELRAKNGRDLTVFLVNTDAQLGLATLTPTQALAFVGSDDTDGRVPAMLNEIPAGVSHPAIMGPLLASRLREVEVDGHHTEHSRLVMRQAFYDLLDGHTTAVGAPAQSVVTDIREQIEDGDGTIAPAAVAWMLEQFERLSQELGIEDPPVLDQSHERAQLRQAMVDTLFDATAAGPRVFSGRVRPLQRSELPALVVFTGDEEEWALDSEAPRVYDVRCDVRVEVLVHGGDNYEAKLDALCLQVEAAVEADETLGGFVNRTLLKRTRFAAEEDGDTIVGQRALVFEVSYLVKAPRTEGPFESFQKAQGEITTTDGASIPFLATPDQSEEES